MTIPSQLSPRQFAAVLVGATMALLCCAAFSVAPAHAATITVTSSQPADQATPDACAGAPNDRTLAAAIAKANDDSSADTIVFDAGITSLALSAALPAVTELLTIDGNGVEIDGSGGFATTCIGNSDFAIDISAAQVEIRSLAIHDVCGRAIKSDAAAPTIRIGPRRADNSVSINGTAADGVVDIYRSDADGEGDSLFEASVPVVGGVYSFKLPTDPAPSDSYTAVATATGGSSSNYSTRAQTPTDLVSPNLLRVVGVANNSVRLDFDEVLGGGSVAGLSFALSMGGANREITGIDISGASMFVASLTTPWQTGEAGAIAITGNGRVADAAGNELLGEPTLPAYAGPGEITGPVISRYWTKWNKFCKAITRRCKRRKQTYLYIRLNKPSRVVFNVYRATTPRRFVLRYVRKLPAGTSKTRLYATMNGRTMPSRRWLVVQATPQDLGRNYGAAVETRFKVVTRNSQF